MSKSRNEPIFEALWNEVSSVHMQWKIYSQIFANQQQIKELETFARTFFHVIHRCLISEIVLSCARLTDRPRMHGRENLSLRQLVPMVEKDDQKLAKKLAEEIGTLKELCDCLIEWRNHSLAHNDLQTALGEVVLPGLQRNKIEDVLASIRSIMNDCERSLLGSITHYQAVMLDDDATPILELVHRAKTS